LKSHLETYWDEILDEERSRLGKQFDPTSYPSPAELVDVQLSPKMLTLPAWSGWLDKQAVQKMQETVLSQVHSAVASHYASTAKRMVFSMKAMMDSVRRWEREEQKNFKSTIVATLLDSVDEFQSVVARLGLKEACLSETLAQVRRLLVPQRQLLDHDNSELAQETAEEMRSNEDRRKHILNQMDAAIVQITETLQGSRVIGSLCDFEFDE
jgi:hypothetical protein